MRWGLAIARTGKTEDTGSGQSLSVEGTGVGR